MANVKTEVDGIFATWLEFRQDVYGEGTIDVITEVNQRTDRAFTRQRFSEYRNRTRTLPDNIGSIINEEMPEIMAWLFKQKLSPEIMAYKLMLPIKNSNQE